jgi:hypothetical protein
MTSQAPADRSSYAGAILLGLSVMAELGCATTLPAPPLPPASMPESAIAEPEATSGMARVVFTTDVPARVERRSRVVSGRRHPVITEDVCSSTPCAVTMTYGDHDVWFVSLADSERQSKETIHVLHPTEVVNHALGKLGSSSLAGILLVATGAALLGGAIGAAVLDVDDGLSGATVALGVAGLGAVTGGIVLTAVFPATHQPGATRQWTPPSPDVVGGSFGLRF